ncbi:MAG: hypothetical protein JXR25_16495 [Pontiellaceae bacterium]|nr:hypothetical protein [Pontiellaceae bacterium]
MKLRSGAPSGLVISLLFHAGAFFIAGLFVVFTVVNKKEPEFIPPAPVERPKMQLKKPKVKVQKSSNPKPSSRIVAKVKSKAMPEIRLPDLMGSGDGLLGGTGIGNVSVDLPEIRTVSLLGTSETTGADLVGTYYDLKRKRGNSSSYTGYEESDYLNVVHDFIDRGWDESVLRRYYQLPRKMYLSTLVVPVVKSSFAPVAFGDDEAAEGGQWLVHYKGKLMHKDGITFRFWAAGDYILGVRVNGKMVVAATWDERDESRGSLQQVFGDSWTPHGAENRQYIFGRNCLAYVGDWITLEPGVPQDIEILVGDENGLACAYLAVEEKGVDYPVSNQGGPILPAFKTAVLSHDIIDAIYPFLPEDEMICLTNGPVFNDFGNDRKTAFNPHAVREEDPCDMRTWTLTNGTTIQAELSGAVSFDETVKLIDPSGKELTIQSKQLSEADLEYIDIRNVPKLDIDFLKSMENILYSSRIAEGDNVRDPELRASFGVRVKQVGTGNYSHELKAEFFAIGRQVFADRYILLAHESVPFRIDRESGKRFEFYSKREVPLRELYLNSSYGHYGEKYHGYIVLVSDELGRLVAHRESSIWLFDHLENLKQLKVGNYLDQTCIRRYPVRPASLIDGSF